MITVLLAAYNGEKFLSAQLDSLIGQSYSDFKILIKDDGSSDGTAVLIKNYAECYPGKISILEGERAGGACANFFELIKAADDDYIMFCDQDDFWLPQKIEKTLAKMQETERLYPEKPILIHSDLKVVNGRLDVISESFFDFQRISPERDALNNLLVQNNVTGCTVMINRRLSELAKNVPTDCAMHDWWLSLLASLFGKTAYIKEPLMLYRQHGENEVGAKKASGIGFVLQKLKNFKQTAGNYSAAISQAESLLLLYGEKMTEAQKETVKAFISLSSGSKLSKIKTIRKYDFRKNTLIRTIGQYFLI